MKDNFIIQTTDLCKHYNGGKIKALDGITTGISKGEVVCIIGPSGSGKTSHLIPPVLSARTSSKHSAIDDIAPVGTSDTVDKNPVVTVFFIIRQTEAAVTIRFELRVSDSIIFCRQNHCDKFA